MVGPEEEEGKADSPLEGGIRAELISARRQADRALSRESSS